MTMVLELLDSFVHVEHKHAMVEIKHRRSVIFMADLTLQHTIYILQYEVCLKGIPPSTYLRIKKILFRHPLSSKKKI